MINYALIGETLLHPTKRAILKTLASNGGRGSRFSPNQLSEMIGEPLGNVSYHVNDLAGRSKDSRFTDTPILELVDTAMRRGAVEHFYSLSRKAVRS